MTDEELRNKTEEFKNRLAEGETTDDLLPEAYAVVREAAFRVFRYRHHEVQLIGGIVLHQGKIAEMKTGEGKTLVSTLPAYLNALEGKGVHIVTVNDYLAKRDSEWMGQVHRFLGLTVGVVLNGMSPEERKEAYNCDITYITNNELGFDYLRDNMVKDAQDQVQRGMHYAVIDEVDSVLIDEARTPLIISGQQHKSTELYTACDLLAKQMQRGEDVKELTKIDIISGEEKKETGDFLVYEKDKIVHLTEEGVKKVESFFHIGNLSDPENIEIHHNMILALRANNLMFKDRDYIVTPEGEVLIVDEFTGRVMPGRRYSDGLHQAIEAKEKVQIRQETSTLATITFQNLFNMYDKKGGMTGTAETEAKEFEEIYHMKVVQIPTNVPVKRIDREDVVYKTKAEKYDAVVEAVREAHKTGRPVLVGTATIEVSELLSRKLKKNGIAHNVLNAKYHEKEAEIIADAGQHGAVTIATNMAGRGTDIKLDEDARAAGGLLVIGTERHESRRIDNQLRGRSGRQGDPGESVFYISLQDDLMRLFGQEKLIETFNSIGIQDGEAIQHKMLSRSIIRAQKRIEGNHYGMRKNLMDYDAVLNEQRDTIYGMRKKVIGDEPLTKEYVRMLEDLIDDKADIFLPGRRKKEWDMEGFRAAITDIAPAMEKALPMQEHEQKKEYLSRLYKAGEEALIKKEQSLLESRDIATLEHLLMLTVIDRKWAAHMDNLEQLKQGVRLQAYGQRDPVVEYKLQAFADFQEMLDSVNEEVLRAMFHCRPIQNTVVYRKESA